MDAKNRDRAGRHAEWLRSLGFTPRDLARVKALLEEQARLGTTRFLALDDLDARWRVATVPKAHRGYFSGQTLGSWAGCALLGWPKGRQQK